MRNVLVVDDDAITLEIVQYMLEEIVEGKIWAFSDSQDAVKFLQQPNRDKIDLIISDWNMPEVDGIEFLDLCRMRSAHTSFIMMTALPTRELVMMSKNLAVDDFVAKPVSVAQLKDKVMSILAFT